MFDVHSNYQEDKLELPSLPKDAAGQSNIAPPFDGSLLIPDVDDPTTLEAHMQRWKADADHRRRVALQTRRPYVQRLQTIVSKTE